MPTDAPDKPLSLKDVRAIAGRGANVIPLVREVPADTLTPVSAFLRLVAPGQRSFLLESVDGGERVARYSFLGCQPATTLIVRDGQALEQHADSDEQALDAPPMQALASRLADYRPADRPGLPRFTGGLVGYVGYDMIRHIEPTVRLDAPDCDEARLMLFRELVAFDHVRHRMLLIANVIDEGHQSLKAAYDHACDTLDRMEDRLGKPAKAETAGRRKKAGKPKKPGKPRSGMSAEQFKAGVKSLKKHIREGDIFQGVLANRFEVDLDVDPFAVYRSLRSINPSPYMFHVDTGDPVVIGASPEMLVRVDDREIETHPIAGTRPRGATDDEDKRHEQNLLASVKERAEHVMLVDLGRNDVGRVAAPGSVHVPSFMHVERYSHVMHIVSRVRGKLARGKSPWDAFAACFPAGTVSGAPKIRAMQLLGDIEPLPRGVYSGAVVYQDFRGNLDSAIAIRSLSIHGRGKKRVARFQAGAGIVADSRPQAEWEEVQHKSGAMLAALQHATEVGS